MDCLESLDFLLSDEGKGAIVQLYVEGIEAYIQSCAEDLTNFRMNRDICVGAFPARSRDVLTTQQSPGKPLGLPGLIHFDKQGNYFSVRRL